MKDKYKAYLYAVVYIVVLYWFGEPLFNWLSTLGINDLVQTVGTVAVLLIPMLYWLRAEPRMGTGVFSVAIGFIVGVLIGKRID